MAAVEISRRWSKSRDGIRIGVQLPSDSRWRQVHSECQGYVLQDF
jgi:hypothetical protein